MRLAWPGSFLGRAWGLAVEPLKGYLDLDLVVRGYALVQVAQAYATGGERWACCSCPSCGCGWGSFRSFLSFKPF